MANLHAGEADFLREVFGAMARTAVGQAVKERRSAFLQGGRTGRYGTGRAAHALRRRACRG